VRFTFGPLIQNCLCRICGREPDPPGRPENTLADDDLRVRGHAVVEVDHVDVAHPDAA